MIDPKMVELNIYNDMPHLLSPVVNEIDRASSVLFWGVKEMERRYQLFSQAERTRYRHATTHICRSATKRSCPTSWSSSTRWPT